MLSVQYQIKAVDLIFGLESGLIFVSASEQYYKDVTSQRPTFKLASGTVQVARATAKVTEVTVC